MKKFKVKDVEIFANSLHDALEIYKHKVKDTEYIKVGSKQVEVLEALPNCWRVDRNATTAPRGYVWINNNKSRFGGERESALIREELVDSISDSEVNDRDYTDEMDIRELEGAILALKNENYKKAMEMVRNVFTSLKFRVETTRHMR